MATRLLQPQSRRDALRGLFVVYGGQQSPGGLRGPDGSLRAAQCGGHGGDFRLCGHLHSHGAPRRHRLLLWGGSIVRLCRAKGPRGHSQVHTNVQAGGIRVGFKVHQGEGCGGLPKHHLVADARGGRHEHRLRRDGADAQVPVRDCLVPRQISGVLPYGQRRLYAAQQPGRPLGHPDHRLSHRQPPGLGDGDRGVALLCARTDC
mmetsp:Transcript_33050/g.77318  ORF Transcript_33050/g.77318 Transcript_33050/m.77318 type:complete len:204 (+) Transcript_33050:178-789(+)